MKNAPNNRFFGLGEFPSPKKFERPELEGVISRWRASAIGVMAILGPFGTGKSVLLSQFREHVRRYEPNPPPTFSFSFESGYSSEVCFQYLVRWIRGDDRRHATDDEIDFLEIDSVLQNEVACPLLVLLDSVDNATTGRFDRTASDASLLDRVLRKAAEGYYQDRVAFIITSRRHPDYIARYLREEHNADALLNQSDSYAPKDVNDCYCFLQLGGVTESVGVNLIRQSLQFERDFEELAQIVRRCEGHPQLIALVATYLKSTQRNVDSLGLEGVSRPLFENEPQEIIGAADHQRSLVRIQRILDLHCEELRKTEKHSLQLLFRLSLFVHPVGIGALESIFLGENKGHISGRELSKATLDQTRQALEGLVARQPVLQTERQQICYRVPTVVRTGIQSRINREFNAGLRTPVHAAILDYAARCNQSIKSIVAPTKNKLILPDSLQHLVGGEKPSKSTYYWSEISADLSIPSAHMNLDALEEEVYHASLCGKLRDSVRKVNSLDEIPELHGSYTQAVRIFRSLLKSLSQLPPRERVGLRAQQIPLRARFVELLLCTGNVYEALKEVDASIEFIEANSDGEVMAKLWQMSLIGYGLKASYFSCNFKKMQSYLDRRLEIELDSPGRKTLEVRTGRAIVTAFENARLTAAFELLDDSQISKVPANSFERIIYPATFLETVQIPKEKWGQDFGKAHLLIAKGNINDTRDLTFNIMRFLDDSHLRNFNELHEFVRGIEVLVAYFEKALELDWEVDLRQLKEKLLVFMEKLHYGFELISPVPLLYLIYVQLQARLSMLSGDFKSSRRWASIGLYGLPDSNRNPAETSEISNQADFTFRDIRLGDRVFGRSALHKECESIWYESDFRCILARCYLLESQLLTNSKEKEIAPVRNIAVDKAVHELQTVVSKLEAYEGRLHKGAFKDSKIRNLEFARNTLVAVFNQARIPIHEFTMAGYKSLKGICSTSEIDVLLNSQPAEEKYKVVRNVLNSLRIDNPKLHLAFLSMLQELATTSASNEEALSTCLLTGRKNEEDKELFKRIVAKNKDAEEGNGSCVYHANRDNPRVNPGVPRFETWRRYRNEARRLLLDALGVSPEISVKSRAVGVETRSVKPYDKI